MDREQEEIQFLGVTGVFLESLKIIFSWKQIFSQITLTLILPLSFIFLFHIEVSDTLFSNIVDTKTRMNEVRFGTPTYEKLSHLMSSQWTYYWLFKIAYFTFFFIFSLLSTAAVVYAIACIYTGKEVSFKKVMSVVPKVWKRLMVTFLFISIAMFAYNAVALVVLVLCSVGVRGSDIGVFVLFGFLCVYLAGIFYLSAVWQLASVVSVLEDNCWIKAITKSRSLIRGKLWVSICFSFILNLVFVAIQGVFQRWVVDENESGLLKRVLYGAACFLLLFSLLLFGFVAHTVIYFVCKSYHHENIDKSALADHLEDYFGDYVPLKSKDVQMEQVHV